MNSKISESTIESENLDTQINSPQFNLLSTSPPATSPPLLAEKTLTIDCPEFVNLLEENLNKPLSDQPIETLSFMLPNISSVKPCETIAIEQQAHEPAGKVLPNHFWKGQIEAQDKYVAGMYAQMSSHDNTMSRNLADKVSRITLPEILELSVQHSSLKSFWSYLESLIHLDGKLVFFYMNSKDELKSSKFYLPGKRDYIPMDDSDMAIIVFDYLISKEIVFEYKVPSVLKADIGCIYMAPLKGKNFIECPVLKKKFSISMPRIKDQFVGVMVDIKTTTNHQLQRNLGLFQITKPS